MSKPKVFYSFHFDNDVMRVQQIRNIGALEGNDPVRPNEWETLQRQDGGVARWIDQNMKGKTHLVVLIGYETSKRPWVDYEIRKAWDSGLGVVGIYIHNLVDPRYSSRFPLFGKSLKGDNPFSRIMLKNGKSLGEYVPCFDPNGQDAYNDISRNLLGVIASAVRMGGG